jgi:hypothetical protein
VVEEYCWALTELARRSCCVRSGSSMLEFRFQFVYVYIYMGVYSHIYTYIFSHVCAQIRLTQNSACAGIFGTLLLPKTVSVRIVCFEFLNDPKFCTILAFSTSSVECLICSAGRTDRHSAAIIWAALLFRDLVHSGGGFSEDSLHG